MADSSQSFVLETLRTSEKLAKAAKLNAHFQFLFVDVLMLFRRLRASQVVVLNGTAGPAYSLLRDVADKTMHLSAYYQNLVTYEDL